MPAVGYRRRTRRRVTDDMSDNIEEDEDAQPQAEEDAVVEDEVEEEQPRRSVKSIKKAKAEKAAGKQPALAPLSDGGDEDAADDFPPVNEATFGNKPLDHHEGAKLQGIASDWNMMEKALRNSAYSLLTEVSNAVAEYADEKSSEKELTRLDILMREIVDIDVEMGSHESTLRELHQQVLGGQEISDVLDRYMTGVQEKSEAYKKKTSRQRYGKNEQYAKFRQSIYEVQHPEEAMPPIVEFLPQEDGDNSDDDDDDIQVGGVVQDLKCPITLTLLVNPLTSSVCSHSFSEEAIKAMLGPSRTVKKMCPAAGCNKQICLNDCKPDKDLERKVKAFARRAQRREEEMDAEEIVE